jgi:hypothetical protein
MIRGQKVHLPELKKTYTKLEKILEVGKHSERERLYLRNAMNSLDVCIESKKNCGRAKKKS